MSCCSTKRSGIACYNPVEETVRYQPPEDEEEDHGGGHDDDNEKKHEKATEASDGKGDEKDEEGYVTKERLHASYCFDEEFHLSITSTCLIIVPLFVFMLLAVCQSFGALLLIIFRHKKFDLIFYPTAGHQLCPVNSCLEYCVQI